MTNDLISRSDLKKAINTYDKFACLPSGKLEPFRNLEHSEMFEPYVHLRDIRNAIDNAPTVFDCRSCKNNGNERECVDCHDYSNYVHYENRRQGVWISVSERLPEDMQKVLIWFEYYRYGDFNCMYQTYGFGYVWDGKWSPVINGETGWQDYRVIAWQPLPEPYQKGDEE